MVAAEVDRIFEKDSNGGLEFVLGSSPLESSSKTLSTLRVTIFASKIRRIRYFLMTLYKIKRSLLYVYI